MSVKEFIKNFISAFQNFKVIRFDLVSNMTVVEYEGRLIDIDGEMPYAVADMTVNTVIPYKDFLYLYVK